MSSSSTQTIELQPIGQTPSNQTCITKNNDPVEFLPQPSTTVNVVERWNQSKVNIARTGATIFAFMLVGANDAAYGVLIPYVSFLQQPAMYLQ